MKTTKGGIEMQPNDQPINTVGLSVGDIYGIMGSIEPATANDNERKNYTIYATDPEHFKRYVMSLEPPFKTEPGEYILHYFTRATGIDRAEYVAAIILTESGDVELRGTLPEGSAMARLAERVRDMYAGMVSQK